MGRNRKLVRDSEAVAWLLQAIEGLANRMAEMAFDASREDRTAGLPYLSAQLKAEGILKKFARMRRGGKRNERKRDSDGRVQGGERDTKGGEDNRHFPL